MMLESIFHTLENEVERLKEKKDWLQQSVDGDGIYSNVIDWSSRADKAIEKAEEIGRQIEEAKNAYCLGLCPILKTLNQLSNTVETTALAINNLRNEQGIDSISFSPSLQQITEPCLYSDVALPSRVLVLNQIIDSLSDPNLNMIGVYGVGGVGKTALLEEVQGKAIRGKLFKIVAMASISRTPSLRRIQAEIADFLGLKLDSENVSLRAALLCERLKKSKVLIILDDLWQKIDLKDVGIPCGEECRLGCKVLLCSRKKDVLSCEMQTQKDFLVGVLEEEEALNLFQTAMPSNAKDLKLQTEIAKKCAGLPLMVRIVAKVLQNNKPNAWDDMLKQLSAFGNDEDIHERVHKVVESSFERLPEEEERSVLLLCALFERSNIPIEHLLIYCMGLNLLSGTNTIEDARNRLNTLIDNLKEHGLLNNSCVDGFVKLPSMVHDVAISIASKLQNAFIGAGQVRLRDLRSNNCTRISLPYCDVGDIVSSLPRCPMAEFFLLSTENPCLEIPDLFFERITGLKVVNITGMCFGSGLPSSLGFLANLHSLCLKGCRINDAAVVTKLIQLRILSFAYSNIVELPIGLRCLDKLKLLDLRNCSDLKVIPADVISSLYVLEELYMLNSFVGWDTRGNARLAELQTLSHLSTLEIQVVDPKLRDFGFFSQLQNYKISIGDKWVWDGRYEASRILKINLEAGIQFESAIKELLKSTEELHMNTMMGIKSLFYQGFPKLKQLHIGYDDGIQHVLNLIAKTSHHGFPVLESLYVYNFDRPEKIYKGKDKICIQVREKSVLYLDGKSFSQLKHLHIRNGNIILKSTHLALCHANPAVESLYLIDFNSLELLSFWKLRSLTVFNCSKMKIVFTFSSARCLPKLQELEAAACEIIEAIVGDDSRCSSNKVNEFTQLSSLKLRKLTSLTVFCKREEETSQTKPLFDEMVSLPNITTLEVEECNSLRYIFSAETAQCLSQLEKLEINNCDFVEGIILNDKFEQTSIHGTVFPKLEYISLCGLQNVRHFANRFPIEFPSLKELFIKECPALNNFVSGFSADKHSDYLFNEMVNFSNLESMSLRNVNNFKFLWHDQLIVEDSFFKLTSLSIAHCSKLSVVFPSNIFGRFQKLESLYLSSCDKVEGIFQCGGVDCEGRNSVQALAFRELQMFNLPSLKYIFPEFIACRLVKLEQVEIHDSNMEVIVVMTKDEISEGTSSVTEPEEMDDVRLPCKQVPIEFPQLRVLKLKNLLYFTGFCNKTEQGFGPQVCFPKLMSLELYKCNSLKYVFTTSLAKCLMQLRKLEIVSCELLVEIFRSTELGEIIHNDIVFSKLDNLALEKLPNLEMFSCGYPVQFPSLTILSISHCSVLKNFVLKHSSFSTEYLFNDMVSFPNLEKMEVRNTNNPKYLWEEQFRDDESFLKLKSLKIEYCLNLHVVFPSNMYRRFLKLETLDLSCCPRVKDIYQCKGSNFVEVFALRVLKIWNLPSLNHIWSKGSNGASSFHCLQSVKVLCCKDLKYVFPKSIACGLVQLQLLKIDNSDVRVIIANDDDDEFETKGVPCFKFPRLSIVQLENLIQISRLYEGTCTLKCPNVKHFEIHGCDKMMILGSEILAYHQQNTELKWCDQVIKFGSRLSFDQQSLSLIRKFIRNLSELTLDHQGLKVTESGDSPVEFSKLNKVTLRCLEEESISLMLGFIRRHFLDKLVIAESFLEEIFLLDDERASEDELHNLNFKQLEVVGDDNLKHILKNCSRKNPILQNLETLSVEFCDRLISIAPSSASFWTLTTLIVSVCWKMENLVTASTAKTMVHLMNLEVSECIMMENIIAEDCNLENRDRIKFTKLKRLELNDLPRLNSFCSGEYSFGFPVLEQVIVNKCFQLKTFCGGTLSTPELKGVVFEDEQSWEENLNDAIASRKCHFK